MTKDENRSFIKKTESLFKPLDVTAISFLGDFNKIFPVKLQNKIMEKGSKKIPYMGFIVDPYCLFLSYEIKDTLAAQKMLPENYELVEASVFKGEKKKPIVIFSAFTARTSAFAGMRTECYIIARNKKSGLISWIITDYETNTNSHDPKNGFCGYSSDPSLFTTTPYGELLIESKSSASGNELSINADLHKTKTRELDEDLWIEGNMSVDYGGVLASKESSPFSLIFDPYLMKEAQELPLEDLIINENTFMNGIIDKQHPVSAAIFPYSQHFIIKQDLKKHEVKNKEDLFKQINVFIDNKNFKRMEGNDIKKPILKGMIISSIANLGVILFLIIKLLTRAC